MKNIKVTVGVAQREKKLDVIFIHEMSREYFIVHKGRGPMGLFTSQ
jgi:hypothetical protein